MTKEKFNWFQVERNSFPLFLCGASKGNLGVVGVEWGEGVTFFPGRKKEDMHELSLGHQTNNMAEDYVLFQGLRIAHNKGIAEIVVIGDSQNIIRALVKDHKPKDV